MTPLLSYRSGHGGKKRPIQPIDARLRPKTASRSVDFLRASLNCANLRLRTARKTVTLVGYGAVFDKPSEVFEDWFGVGNDWVEYVDKAAFDDVLKTDPDVRCVFNHDQNIVLGRTKSGTLKLEADETGLRYEVDLPDSGIAREMVLEPIKRGDIDQSSFAFTVAKESWEKNEDGPDVRTFLKVGELFDVSPVTYPAFPDASVALKSRERYFASDSSTTTTVVANPTGDKYDSAKDDGSESPERDKKDLERKIESLKEQLEAALSREKVLLDRLNKFIKEDKYASQQGKSDFAS